jgi:hypothetical protein
MTAKPRNIHVLLRGAEAGGITRADIERRASELARIRDDRAEVTESDLITAARELLGENSPATMVEDQAAEVSVTRDPADVPVKTGHKAEEAPAPADENAEPERLAIQGVEEAQHDQMVEARRARIRHKDL